MRIGLVFAGVMLLCGSAFAIGCGRVHILVDREAEYLHDYVAWGEQANYGRDDGFTWKDGSSWGDGISDKAPDLPLVEGQSPDAVLTCAQEEVLWLMTFPDGESLLADGLSQEEKDRITGMWEDAFAERFRGPGAAFDELRSFADQCGELTLPE